MDSAALLSNSSLRRSLDALAGRMRASDPRRLLVWVGFTAFGLSLVGVCLQFLIVDPGASDRLTRPLKQLIFAFLGICTATIVVRIGYRRIVAIATPLLVVSWVALIYLALTARGTQAARWIEVSPLKFQPSEVAKLALLLHLAGFAVSRGPALRSFQRGFIPAALALFVTAGLVVIAPDLGQTLFIVATSGALLFVAGIELRHLIPTTLLAAGLALITMSLKWGYVSDRFDAFFNDQGGYQVREGILFLQRGGFSGVGLTEARGWMSVPEIHNDFILVALGEIFGFVGILGVSLAFFGLLWAGLAIALGARTRLGMLVAFATCFLLGLQTVVNFGVVSGSIPPKGMALPFLSYGGSSMLVSAAAVGLLLSVGQESLDPPSASV